MHSICQFFILGRTPNTILHSPFLGALQGTLYYKLELRTNVGVEENLEDPVKQRQPLLAFRGSNLGAIVRDALKPHMHAPRRCSNRGKLFGSHLCLKCPSPLRIFIYDSRTNSWRGYITCNFWPSDQPGGQLDHAFSGHFSKKNS